MDESDKPAVLDYEIRLQRKVFFQEMGGWRQIVFAFGLACLMLGLGASVSRFLSDGSLIMGFGGLIVGLVYPLPRRNQPAE